MWASSDSCNNAPDFHHGLLDAAGALLPGQPAFEFGRPNHTQQRVGVSPRSNQTKVFSDTTAVSIATEDPSVETIEQVRRGDRAATGGKLLASEHRVQQILKIPPFDFGDGAAVALLVGTSVENGGIQRLDDELCVSAAIGRPGAWIDLDLKLPFEVEIPWHPHLQTALSSIGSGGDSKAPLSSVLNIEEALAPRFVVSQDDTRGREAPTALIEARQLKVHPSARRQTIRRSSVDPLIATCVGRRNQFCLAEHRARPRTTILSHRRLKREEDEQHADGSDGQRTCPD